MGGVPPLHPVQPTRPLRSKLRASRRRLTPHEQRQHALAVTKRIRSTRAFLSASRIALYWPADGELDPRPLMAIAEHLGKDCYLPVLSPIGAGKQGRKLWMARHRPSERMPLNRFGIPEPAGRGRHLIAPRRLDLLIVPLVGFDHRAHRIGMGGGFYDRTLSYLRHARHWRRPRLFGIAHECQRLERIEPQPWDVPLDAVFTESGIYTRGAGAKTAEHDPLV